MMRALDTAATGLGAQSANLERVSNDLANVNTDGYKRGRLEFQDLMYQTIKEPGAQVGVASTTPVGIQAGMGVKVGASHKVFEQGPAKMTYHPYDLMIEGKGFFQVQLPNGGVAYTRNGAFHVDAQGIIQLSNGAQLIPQMTVPNNAMGFAVAPNGEVRVQLPGEGEAVIGQIQLANFSNEQGLQAMGAGLFKAAANASGAPTLSVPGEAGTGYLMQGGLEGSNVNVANSMVDMITTQRAYEMNTKVMNVADQMLGATSNIK